MHLYGESRDTGEAFKVNQWNGVDVVINGTLQHGIVVGISAVSADGQKHGLLIDFNCPQRHSEFAEYGNIFSCPDTIANPCERWTQVAKWAETHPLQALIRVGADRAWTWWPVKQVVLEGTLRRACCNEIDCELVEVQWGDAVTKELIPLRQVRCVPSPQDLQQRRVGPDYFVSRECRLPKGYWSAPPGATRRLWQDLSRGRRACCVAVRTDSFTYFQRNSREIPKLSLDGVESAFSDVIKSGFVQHSHGSQGDGSPEGEWDGRRFVPPREEVKPSRPTSIRIKRDAASPYRAKSWRKFSSHWTPSSGSACGAFAVCGILCWMRMRVRQANNCGFPAAIAPIRPSVGRQGSFCWLPASSNPPPRTPSS
ncbi:uncharacterized protein LOC129591004 [Paramacrobiotus metropolitanus]|uniref:uncharacterized protein LOC129591004 n=1 Tax=Paramacrobiotus metropolitanus TaxID=2943436 RepID=UPI002445CA63|nr:uncharacterized protein LOC129591004 [Paramacrobiotus metropolitanus]